MARDLSVSLEEIERYWSLEDVFTACDRLAHWRDVATWLRPRPAPPPRRAR